MFATLFFRYFLNLKMYNTTLDRISHYMAYIILLFLPMPYIFNENTFYIALGVGFLYTITVFIASIHVYGKGFKPAKYFIMAWGFLIIGVMASTIATKNNFIREYASMIGSILQMIFIVFAILSKTKRIQKEKDQISLEISGMRRELDMAKKIQLSLLPEKPPKIKGCDIGTYYLPMKEIGGDFYDFYEKDDKSFSCLVADVSGHGAAAALIASMLKVSFSSTADLYNQPREALLKMNRSLLGNLGKKFVTAVYAHIDLREKTLTYSSAGHPAILVQRRSEQRIIYLEPKGQFLGWFDDIKLREYTFSIEIGDRILIYTDGLIEAFNDKHVMFDYDHLEEALMKNTSLSAEGLTYFLGYHIKEWVGFTRDFEDDITLVTVDIV
jgi:serine phosphatase RsbU (regulator of sigma subunit)